MLLAGVVAAWLVGAVGEELLYRAFFLDTIRALLPGDGRSAAVIAHGLYDTVAFTLVYAGVRNPSRNPG